MFVKKKCGFFKRFEPQEMKKLSELTISEEEISNDVIDVSKECSKLDTCERTDLLSHRENSTHNANKINYQYRQQTKLLNGNDYDDKLINGKANISCNTNCNDETNKAKRTTPSELVIYSVPKIDILKASSSNQTNQNLNDFTKSKNLLFSTFQASNNNNQQTKANYSILSNKSTQKDLLSQPNSNLDKLNASNPVKIQHIFNSLDYNYINVLFPYKDNTSPTSS